MDEYTLKYLDSLTDKIFKMLPLYGIYEDHLEDIDETFYKYSDGLKIELKGALNTFNLLSNPNIIGRYISVVNIISYLSDKNIEIDSNVFRREIFRAINILMRLKRG